MPGSRAVTRSSLQATDTTCLSDTDHELTESQAPSHQGVKTVVTQATTRRGVKRKAVEASASPEDKAPGSPTAQEPQLFNVAQPARSRAASRTAKASTKAKLDTSKGTNPRGSRNRKASGEAEVNVSVSAAIEPEISQHPRRRKAVPGTNSVKAGLQQDAAGSADPTKKGDSVDVAAANETSNQQQSCSIAKQGKKAATKRTAAPKGFQRAGNDRPATGAPAKPGRQHSKRQRTGQRNCTAERDTEQGSAISSRSDDEADADIDQHGEQGQSQVASVHNAAKQSAAKRTRNKASAAKSTDATTGSSKADKAQKATAGRPAASSASGAVQPARTQRRGAQRRQNVQQIAQQQQQKQQQRRGGSCAGQGNSNQTVAAIRIEPLSSTAKADTAALASKVLQQTLGMGPKAKPSPMGTLPMEDHHAGDPGELLKSIYLRPGSLHWAVFKAGARQRLPILAMHAVQPMFMSPSHSILTQPAFQVFVPRLVRLKAGKPCQIVHH